jgi:hypothetical protein
MRGRKAEIETPKPVAPPKPKRDENDDVRVRVPLGDWPADANPIYISHHFVVLRNYRGKMITKYFEGEEFDVDPKTAANMIAAGQVERVEG